MFSPSAESGLSRAEPSPSRAELEPGQARAEPSHNRSELEPARERILRTDPHNGVWSTLFFSAAFLIKVGQNCRN